jgi:hypothetical protein
VTPARQAPSTSTPPGTHGAARAFAERVRTFDPVVADLLAAQADRLARDDAETRAREAALLAAVERRQIGLGSRVLDGNLLVLSDGPARHVWVFDEDLSDREEEDDAGLLALWDGSSAFDRVRERLAAAIESHAIASLSGLVFGTFRPLARLLDTVSLRDRITSLSLRSPDFAPVPRVARELPTLRTLSVAIDRMAAALGAGHPALRHLILGSSSAKHALDWLKHAALPRLEHLALRHARLDEVGLAALADLALVPQLHSLELFSSHHAFPFDALLALRPRFNHLERILLGGHIVPTEILQRFDDWPQVRFVSHDRRELLAFDLETTGWPYGLR